MILHSPLAVRNVGGELLAMSEQCFLSWNPAVLEGLKAKPREPGQSCEAIGISFWDPGKTGECNWNCLVVSSSRMFYMFLLLFFYGMMIVRDSYFSSYCC